MSKQEDLTCSCQNYHCSSFLCLYAFIYYQRCLLLFKFNSTDHNICTFKYETLKSLRTLRLWSRSTELTYAFAVWENPYYQSFYVAFYRVCFFFHPCMPQNQFIICLPRNICLSLKKKCCKGWFYVFANWSPRATLDTHRYMCIGWTLIKKISWNFRSRKNINMLFAVLRGFRWRNLLDKFS